MQRTWATVVFMVTCWVWAGPAQGWNPSTQRTIALQAARIAPPDLYRQLVRNRASYLVGVEEPFRSGSPEARFKYPDGSGQLDAAIAEHVGYAVQSIRGHRPFNEVAYRLGVVAHYLAMANNPSHAAASDPEEARWGRDFVTYMESIEPRVRIVFYGFRGQQPLSVDGLVAETLSRSRSLYPVVGREYRRVGFASGVRAFDDRSSAYAVAALGYSHAVSDIAEVLRYIWLEAGGIDTRPSLPRRGQGVVPLSPLGGSPASPRTTR
ncbi:MAG: hypothetical protein AAGN66_05165 [Acidobacteriota bacterium]